MAKLTAEQQQLIDMESQLGITPRRDLSNQLEDIKRDLTHLEQLLGSNSYDLSKTSAERAGYILARRHVAGIIERNYG